MNNHASVTYELQPNWNELDKIEEVLESFFKANYIPESHYDPIYMVTTELVENSIKYGSFTSEKSKILLSIKYKKNRIIVEVKNPISEKSASHLHKLDSKIQWIRGFQNPFEAYVERLREVSSKTLEEGESGLGLVRIAYEGQSLLDFYLDEQNNLTVIAEYVTN
jgi:hypothetical protein